MKRKSILMSIISLFTVLSLNGCFFDTLQSIMDEKYSEFLGNYPDESVEPIDRENDNSIKLLDLAEILHNKNIVHRDIRISNVIMNKNKEIRLIHLYRSHCLYQL